MNLSLKLTSKTEIINILSQVGTQSQFITMFTETEVKMNKTRINDQGEKVKNPFTGLVTKTQTRNGLLNVDFKNAILRNMKKDGIENPSYELGEVWYDHDVNENGKKLCVVHHKKNTESKYLQYFPMKTLGQTKYFHDGKELTSEEVTTLKMFFPKTTKSEYKPLVNVFKIESLKEIRLRKINLVNETIERLLKKSNFSHTLNPQQESIKI